MRRPALLPAGTALLLALAGPLHAADAPPAPDHSIRAPQYGDVLYRFYQDQYFDAITTLMASQHFDRLGLHSDEAEVLRGGMMLSYGMHREAGAVFERLVERGAEPAVRDRAWFYLAKVRHARGLTDEAAQALARIQGALPPELDDERQLLQAQVKLALNDPAAAAAALTRLASAPPRPPAPLPGTAKTRPSLYARIKALVLAPFSGVDPLAAKDADASLFARFNLGVSLIRAGDMAGGSRWLDELGRLPAANEEQRALRDRANLALGFAALQRREPEDARRWLERIRLNGPSSNKALLGFGWAAMALNKPRQALVPWTELAGRDEHDPAVLEARIAVPHALAELGADAQALTGYETALAGFERETGGIDAAMASLQSGPWLDELITLNPGAEMGWFRQVAALPSLPHAGQLAPVLASHDFQEGFKTWRDLHFLRQNLQSWQETLVQYRDMLAQRRDTFNARLPDAAQQASRVDLAPLRQRQQALDSALQQAEADADGLAFATRPQREALRRLERARAGLATAGSLLSPAEMTAAGERIRLLAGVLRWDLAQAYPDRSWQAHKALQQSAAGLQQAVQPLQDLAQAKQVQGARFAEFNQRIDALAQRIQQLQQPLDQAWRDQAQSLQALTLARLADQKDRLAGYSTQARFAMAQLHDRARQPLPETTHDDAPR